MKRSKVLIRMSLAALFCLAIFPGGSPAFAGGDRHDRQCKRICDDEFQRRKLECRGLRGRDRHRCQDRAKREHNDCKHRCR